MCVCVCVSVPACVCVKARERERCVFLHLCFILCGRDFFFPQLSFINSASRGPPRQQQFILFFSNATSISFSLFLSLSISLILPLPYSFIRPCYLSLLTSYDSSLVFHSLSLSQSLSLLSVHHCLSLLSVHHSFTLFLYFFLSLSHSLIQSPFLQSVNEAAA